MARMPFVSTNVPYQMSSVIRLMSLRCRSVSESQPRPLASSARAVASSRCWVRTGMWSLVVWKLGQCSQMFAVISLRARRGHLCDRASAGTREDRHGPDLSTREG